MARFHHLFQRPARSIRVRDTRVVHEHIETAEFVADSLCCGSDGALIGDIELDGASVVSDTLRRPLAVLEAARPDEDREAVPREVFRDLKSDSFVGPGY
jgi:hypothetical protein